MYACRRWFGLGLIAVLSAVGCDDTEGPRSKKGESCLNTADCKEGLACFDRVCLEPDTVGSRSVGEACLSHVDCEADLVCAASVCREADAPLLGGLGERCASSTDCRSDLACVYGGCLERDVELPASGKECLIIECDAHSDCCDAPSQACQQLAQACKDDNDHVACNDYSFRCACEYACKNHMCEAARTCFRDRDCRSDSPYCRQGVCAECKKAEHCADGYDCVKGWCERPCEKDGECGALQECMDGECVDVGCSGDRDCVTLLGAARAVCANGECGLPCAHDADCWSIDGFGYVCEKGACLPAGCTANAQCRGYRPPDLPTYYPSPFDEFPNARAVCR